jgi:hypothetical protein
MRNDPQMGLFGSLMSRNCTNKLSLSLGLFDPRLPVFIGGDQFPP